MKIDNKAIKGGILLATFGLVSFLGIIHFLFDGLQVPFKKGIIQFFLIACIINYSLSILVSQFCLKAVRAGKNPKLMGLTYTMLSLILVSVFFNVPYIAYECALEATLNIEHLNMLAFSAIYCFAMGFIPALVISIPYGLYLNSDLL